MTVNLLEFLKVFIVVFGVASGITFFRKSFIDDTGSSDTSESNEEFLSKNKMDYDGMGNFGRFPAKIKREKR